MRPRSANSDGFDNPPYALGSFYRPHAPGGDRLGSDRHGPSDRTPSGIADRARLGAVARRGSGDERRRARAPRSLARIPAYPANTIPAAVRRRGAGLSAAVCENESTRVITTGNTSRFENQEAIRRYQGPYRRTDQAGQRRTLRQRERIHARSRSAAAIDS